LSNQDGPQTINVTTSDLEITCLADLAVVNGCAGDDGFGFSGSETKTAICNQTLSFSVTVIGEGDCC
jgi:hypothetical protein